MRRRIITLLIFASVAAAAFVSTKTTFEAFGSGASPQPQRTRRPQPRRARAAQSSRRKPAVDYSKFLHASRAHEEQKCDSCHRTPTANWKRARDFPDVADFPDHDACLRCHRQQFFTGARPSICTVCHTRVSPRDGARFAFRKPTGARQFEIEFPHDKHQDVIASHDAPTPPQARREVAATTTRGARFVNASFVAPTHAAPPQDEKTKTYNNCAICHTTREKIIKPPAGGWPDAFAPPVGTFKTVPSSHASCFNCHWQNQAPTKDDCAGCHKTTAAYFLAPAPKRLSLKFTHAREQHVAECATCHINITKAETLRGLTPDVPVTACSECHNKPGLRQDVSNELDRLDKDKNFACTYCHTSEVGKLDAPASHYLISERAPLKRQEIK